MRVLQTSCGALAVASLVAIGQTPPEIAVHDGAATVASAHPAIPTDWRNAAGPLAIPTIGVVPPGTEGWFDPSAQPTFRAQHPAPTAVSLPSTMPTRPDPTTTPTDTSPAASTPLAATDPAPPTGSTSADATPSSTTPGTTTPGTTTPGTTTPGTTTPGTTTPGTTTPGTTTPGTTTPGTTTPPSTTPETPPPSTTTPPPTPEPTPTTPPVPTNARGNLVLAFGEELTVFDGATGAVAFAVAVDAVTTGPLCTDPLGPPAANGTLVAVQLRVTTGPDLSAVGGVPEIRATDFAFLAADGVTLTAAATPSAGACTLGTGSFPAGPLAPGQELTGSVVLDVPTTPGTLVLAPDFLTVGAEWAY